MNQVPIKLGPLTLLLTVISICLTTLSILTFTTARADMRLAEKYADTVETRYSLEQEGQVYLREVASSLHENPGQGPAGTETDAKGVIWKTFEKDRSRLRIGIVVRGEDYKVVAWKQDKEWDEDTEIGDLWY